MIMIIKYNTFLLKKKRVPMIMKNLTDLAFNQPMLIECKSTNILLSIL